MICDKIKEKISHIANLNDAKLESYQIQGLIDNVLGGDPDRELSEFEKTFLRINVLNLKKIRLTEEIKNVEDELKTLEIKLYQSFE